MWSVRFVCVLCVCALSWAVAPAGAHAAKTSDDVVLDWQPRYPGDIFADLHAKRAVILRRRDWVVYGGNDGSHFAIYDRGPKDGGAFVYGSLKTAVVADAEHGIAYASRGCCSWKEEALGYVPAAPVRGLVNRRLAGVRTARGVRLGMQPADIRRLVANAPLRLILKTDFAEMSYAVPYTFPPDGTDCDEFLHYVFRQNRLVLISFTDAC